MSPSRRRFLRYSAAGALLGLAGCSAEETTPTETSTDPDDGGTPSAQGTDRTTAASLPETVRARRVADGFTAPVGFETVPGRDGEWVVVDQDGRVWLYDGSSVRERPFLDVRERMVSINTGYDERGLLGLAFHPEFAANGKLYVRYSAPKRDGTSGGYSHTFVLAEFTADPGADRVPRSSERTVLEISQPQSNHNAGAIAFGADGYLYVGVGDGGGAGDRGSGHVDDWYDPVAGGNGQDVTENLLGSVLRIDVDGRDGSKGYAVPADNPLVDAEGLPEHYAWGFRNPWRFSFDGEDLYVADVGQNEYEEVDRVVAGGNYGWNVREATHCFGADECPSETSDGRPLRSPIVEYDHGGQPPNGAAVIGGYRYRGEALPGLAGTYVFSDWRLNGSLFVAQPADSGLWPVSLVDLETEGGGSVGPYALAFGRGTDSELVVCTTQNGGPRGSTGAVYELVGTA